MENKKKYLTIRQIADRLGNPKLYHRVRRKVIKAYRSGKWGNDIINTGDGVNLGILVEESVMYQVIGGRP
jgi:hypothetical protein